MRVVAGFSICGLVMGLLTSLVGLGNHEFWVWMALYAMWMFALLQQPVERPLVLVTMSSALCGLVTGATQIMLYAQYSASNPHLADRLSGDVVQDAPAFLGLGLVAGLVFGVQIGAALEFIARRRRNTAHL